MRKLLIFFLGAMSATGPAPATAAIETFDFTGDCADCAGSVSAQLILRNYQIGDPIKGSNFVSLHYAGSNLYNPFTISGSSNLGLAGEMAGPGAPATFLGVTDANHMFFSFGSGFWGVGDPGKAFADFGFSHVYTLAPRSISATPEPAAWALMIMGVGAAGAVKRRRQRTTVGFA